MIALLIFYPHSFVELSPGTESFLKQMELFRANFQNAMHFIPVFEILLGSEQFQIM